MESDPDPKAASHPADGRRGGRRRRRYPPGISHPVDVHVGSRVRMRRTLLGMSQQRLGDAVGLTFQQIQKYERGANRIGSSRLFEFSKILDVPVSFFFDDMPADTETAGTVPASGMRDRTQAPLEANPLSRPETRRLVEGLYGIPDPYVRRQVYELARSMAVSGDHGD